MDIPRRKKNSCDKIALKPNFQVEKYSNKVAHYFKKEGFQRGDTVALLLENRPEYVCIWLGLGKIGVVTALINHNLVADPLVHSINVSSAKAVIYGASLKKGTTTTFLAVNCTSVVL